VQAHDTHPSISGLLVHGEHCKVPLDFALFSTDPNMLKIHNSLSGRKEPFQPLQPDIVQMYVCGITVYDYCHVGHARMLVVFDLVARWIRHQGFDLTYVRNITDIDDKIIRRAEENGETIDALTARFITAMHEDFAALKILPPDLEPRATEHMPQILDMIVQLIERGFAYQSTTAEGKPGDVLFDVSKFEAYGRLSGKKIDELRVGARVAVDEAKDDAVDFVLWKQAKAGEPAWPSPWGDGRPGWHIECSAMSTHSLGTHFDIHGGGLDLKFPHHENELAQSVCATGHAFVNLWMHNGFVNVDDEKMSKSLGNFFTIRDVLAHYQPEVVRYFIVASHYRSPLNYSDSSLDQARAALERLYTALKGLTTALGDWDETDPYCRRFGAAMNDDFNTPEALAVLFELARDINRERDSGELDEANRLAGLLRRLAAPLGLLEDEAEAFLQGSTVAGEFDAAAIESLIVERETARADKNWGRADEIRDQLAADGVILEDGGGKTTWRRD